ncbi:MAG: hypothetical protein ACI8RD_012782 [Bacillariaceae sp.]|jgi:hypothetical protein
MKTPRTDFPHQNLIIIIIIIIIISHHARMIMCVCFICQEGALSPTPQQTNKKE